MTREQVKAALPILQAFAEGKTIQFRDTSENWSDFGKAEPIDGYVFYNYPERYRVKPEPLEFWMNVYENGSFGNAFRSETGASDARNPLSNGRTIKFREVL